jgi:flagellar basal-body rod protein FlgG
MPSAVGNIIEIAGIILARSDWRAELSAQNIANITTPGYKSQRSFDTMIDTIAGDDMFSTAVHKDTDWTDGKLASTHNDLDLAIAGNGFFVVRQGDKTFYTRAGHFVRDADGHVLTADGARLQAAGGDLKVQGSMITIDNDGTLHDGNKASQQIALVDFADKTALRDAGNDLYMGNGGGPQPVASPDIHQGMLEASNVSDATEMITLMTSLRSAETGQKIVQLYDDLMAQAATSFGQGAG